MNRCPRRKLRLFQVRFLGEEKALGSLHEDCHVKCVVVYLLNFTFFLLAIPMPGM